MKREQSQADVLLVNLIWSKKAVGYIFKGQSPLETTERLCRMACSELGLAHFPSPLYFLVDHLEFLLGITDARFRNLIESGQDRVTFFITRGEWDTFDSLIGDQRLNMLGRFEIFQVAHFLKSLPPPIMFLRDMTRLEEEFCKKGEAKNMLSKMYKVLIEAKVGEVTTLPYFENWEKELNIEFSENKRKKIFNSIHHWTLSTKYQENSLKS